MSTNSVGPNGVTIQSLPDIIAEITSGFQAIYGASINTNPNSPDGQMINLIAQAKYDVLEFLQNIASSMDPDQASGVLLDQRAAINGISRNTGSYTFQYITITVSQAVTLPGMSSSPTNPFTAADAQGNQYYLVSDAIFGSAGSASVDFQAATMGPVTSALNTITVPVTIMAGVVSVNNPSTPAQVGVAEETDVLFRIRRGNSVALPSKGWLAGMYAALYNVTGVTQVVVIENNTAGTVSGIPANGIWCIVAGGTTAAVAAAINLKRNGGVPMKGSTTYTITEWDGSTLVISFDRPTAENLYFHATLTAITGTIDKVWIAAQVLSQFGASYGINQSADSASIVAYIKAIAPNASVASEAVSINGSSWVSLVAPTGINYQFTIPSSSYVTIS